MIARAGAANPHAASRAAAHDLLGHHLHFVHDALPFRNRRRGLHALELVAEGARVRIARKARIGPRGAARRQVSRERVESLLHVGLRQVFDQAPCRVLVARRLDHHEARSARDRGARAIGPGKRRRHPVALALGRQALAELGDVPGTRDIESEKAAAELSPDVRDLCVAHAGRPLVAKRIDVEGERVAKAFAAKISATPAVREQGFGALQAQRQQRLEFVQGKEHRVALGPSAFLDRSHHARPLFPRARRIRAPRCCRAGKGRGAHRRRTP